MTKEERALIKKIEAKFPRDKAQKGEVKIELNGESVCPARDAIDHVEYILGRAARLAEKKGTFRIVKVARAGGAGRLAGLTDEECDYIWDTDIWFVIPKKMKDPTQEYGPCYTLYFKEDPKPATEVRSFIEGQDREFATYLNDTQINPATDSRTLKDATIEHRIAGRFKNASANCACEIYSHGGAVCHWKVKSNREFWAPGKDKRK